MGGGISLSEDGIDKEAAAAFLGESFDESKFHELAGESKLITRAQAIGFLDSSMKNSALIFIKPHANTEPTRKLVVDKISAAGCTIVAEGSISGTEIDELKLIDQHYYAIASKATILKPSELVVPTDKFESAFGEPYDKAIAEDRVFNALDACGKFSCDSAALDAAWRQSEKNEKVTKFGGGYYCGLVSVGDQPPLYVFNAFFMNMRSKFVGESNSIYFYSVEWNPYDMKWVDFRGKLIG